MLRTCLAITICLSATATAEIPYLTDEEEAAVCEFWSIQYEHLRDTGEYAPFEGLVTGDGQSYLHDPAWTDDLGRFQVLASLPNGYYEYAGLSLQSRDTGADQLVFRMFPFGFYVLYRGTYPDREEFSGEINCADSTGNAAEDRSRVLDDLISLREGVWLYRIHFAQYPDSLTPIIDFGRYVKWAGTTHRWGHQISYASDGTTYVVAAWPMRGETTQTNGFHLDQTGVIREGTGAGAGPNNPPVPDALPTNAASLGPFVANERAALDVLCEIYHAQEAYKLETGGYTNAFADLQRDPSPPYFDRDMGIAYDGYTFNLGGSSGGFRAYANAVEYGVTGIRGFRLDSTGFVRANFGGDGEPDSPIIGTVCEIDESFQPTGVSLPGPARVDVNGDYQISLSELLQLVQHYNVGAYHCDADSTDGYTTGPGAQDCPPLEMDSAPQDWAISLPELLRGIQLYNSGVYFPCPGSEDGLCVPAEPVA